jgi:hypothetical protein
VPTKQNQIDWVKTYITRMSELIADLAVFPRVPSRSIFDSVACAVLSKAFCLSDSAVILIEAGHPEEAFGLVRSVVECALNLRYLTQDKNGRAARATAFADFYFRERQYWLRDGLHNSADVVFTLQIEAAIF